MGWLVKACKSSVGAKFLMALTGLGLFVFVILHMLGNLLVFQGPDTINTYAKTLKSTGGLLWVARFGLLGIFVAHVLTSLRLSMLNRAARPQAYTYRESVQSTFASRSMLLSGLVLFFFIAYHLAHFTFGVTHPEQFSQVDAQGRHNVYAMMVAGFTEPGVAIPYMLAMVFLGLHLYHGISSSFQSLGVHNRRARPLIKRLGPILALAITLGNISMPLACLTGYVRLSGGLP